MQLSYMAIPGVKKGHPSFNISRAEQIIKLVCEKMHVTEFRIKDKCRRQEYLWPRQIAMYLIKRNTNLSLLYIGGLFDRDHTTVIHSITTVKNRMTTEPVARHIVNEIERGI